MTKIRLDYLIWKEWNAEHFIKKHSVTKKNVEEAILNVKAHKYGYLGRIILFGESEGKIFAVIVARKTVGKYFVVTARPARRDERKLINEKSK